MTNKFKIGDIVVCSNSCSNIKEHPWFHKNDMKIIGISDFYYYTDYWDSGNPGFLTNKIINNVTYEGITEECLCYSIKQIRKDKLKKLQN